MDEIIAEYKKAIDRTLLRRNLRKTFTQRAEDHQRMAQFREELIAAKKKTSQKQGEPR